MNQLIIDPNNRGNPKGEKAFAQISPEARQFGYVPDLEYCKAGDLILSHSVARDYIETGIINTQLKAGLAEDDSRWTHAAVYLYEDFILEADPKLGVRSRSLYSDVPGSCFRVRRRQNLKEADRYKIALCAQRMLGMRYDLGAALSLGLRARVSEMWNRYWAPRMKKEIICSQVFYDAYAEITRHFLSSCPTHGVMPAHLSATSDLEDISVPWLKII